MDAKAIFSLFYDDARAGQLAASPPVARTPLLVRFVGRGGGKVRYIAAQGLYAHAGFSGSGYPYTSARQAFDATTNMGLCEPGTVVELDWPNAYYDCGTRPCCVHVSYEDRPGSSCSYTTYELPALVNHRAVDPDATRGPVVDREVLPLDEKLLKHAYRSPPAILAPVTLMLV